MTVSAINSSPPPNVDNSDQTDPSVPDTSNPESSSGTPTVASGGNSVDGVTVAPSSTSGISYSARAAIANLMLTPLGTNAGWRGSPKFGFEGVTPTTLPGITAPTDNLTGGGGLAAAGQYQSSKVVATAQSAAAFVGGQLTLGNVAASTVVNVDDHWRLGTNLYYAPVAANGVTENDALVATRLQHVSHDAKGSGDELIDLGVGVLFTQGGAFGVATSATPAVTTAAPMTMNQVMPIVSGQYLRRGDIFGGSDQDKQGSAFFEVAARETIAPQIFPHASPSPTVAAALNTAQTQAQNDGFALVSKAGMAFRFTQGKWAETVVPVVEAVGSNADLITQLQNIAGAGGTVAVQYGQPGDMITLTLAATGMKSPMAADQLAGLSPSLLIKLGNHWAIGFAANGGINQSLLASVGGAASVVYSSNNNSQTTSGASKWSIGLSTGVSASQTSPGGPETLVPTGGLGGTFPGM